MIEFTKALHTFWSNFGLPAYQQDQVPPNTPFPYVTYEVVQGGAFGGTVLTARAWYKDEQGRDAATQVMEFLDMVKEAIPTQGRRLSVSDGFFILRPNNAGFLSFEADPSTENERWKIISGRVSYEINYYL